MSVSFPAGWPPPMSEGRRVVVLAGGDPEPAAFVRGAITDSDLVIAANGGSRLARDCDIVPHLLVGDVDSLAPEEAARLPAETLRWQHPQDKDASDLELALEAAFAVQPVEIVVLGGFGGRVDHMLVNVGLLHMGTARAIPVRLLSARGEALVVEGSAELDWPEGHLLTALAVTPQVTGVCLSGVAWPLQNATLEWGSSRGLSNVVRERPVRIALEKGRLLVLGSRGGRTVAVRRTWLELTDASRVASSPLDDAPHLRLERVERCTPSLYRFLYGETGRDYHWVDRGQWDDARLIAHLSQSGLEIWMLHERGGPAGWFELTREGDAVQLAYFGLLPGHLGRGLGAHLLVCASRRAFAMGATRVFVNTCTLDDAAAMPNYLKRGFTPYREDVYDVTLHD